MRANQSSGMMRAKDRVDGEAVMHVHNGPDDLIGHKTMHGLDFPR